VRETQLACRSSTYHGYNTSQYEHYIMNIGATSSVEGDHQFAQGGEAHIPCCNPRVPFVDLGPNRHRSSPRSLCLLLTCSSAIVSLIKSCGSVVETKKIYTLYQILKNEAILSTYFSFLIVFFLWSVQVRILVLDPVERQSYRVLVSATWKTAYLCARKGSIFHC
jgi:hypothetical protein